jgi:CHAT domain-containing protein
MAPAAALQAAQRWLRTVTNAELADLFRERQEQAPDRPRMPYKVAQDEFTTRAGRDRDGRPYAAPYFWAPFTFQGA